MTGFAPGRGHLGRNSLRLTIVLGALITAMGSTGIFAVFSDRATTGASDITTGQLPTAVDLHIAMAARHADGSFDCGAYSDDLTTPLFASTMGPGSGDERAVCISNSGSSGVNLSMSAIDLVDADIACTGDEAGFGDTTCGPDANNVPQQGELSPHLRIDTKQYDCPSGQEQSPQPGVVNISTPLADLATTPGTLNSLWGSGGSIGAAGSTVCITIQIFDTATGTNAQLAQSDEATWRFAFDGIVP